MKYFKIVNGKKEVLPTLIDVKISIISPDEWIAILSELGFRNTRKCVETFLKSSTLMFTHAKADLTLLFRSSHTDGKFHFIPMRDLDGKWDAKGFKDAYESPFSVHLGGNEDLKDALREMLLRLREMYQ